MRRTVYLRESVKWREQWAEVMVSCCSREAAAKAQRLLSQQTGGCSVSRSNEDCPFHHRRAADFLHISSLLLSESLRQMSQRVGTDFGRRLCSGTTKSMGLEHKVKSQGDASCFGTEKAQPDWGRWVQSWAEKAPSVLKTRTSEFCLSATTLQGRSKGSSLTFLVLEL